MFCSGAAPAYRGPPPSAGLQHVLELRFGDGWQTQGSRFRDAALHDAVVSAFDVGRPETVRVAFAPQGDGREAEVRFQGGRYASEALAREGVRRLSDRLAQRRLPSLQTSVWLDGIEYESMRGLEPIAGPSASSSRSSGRSTALVARPPFRGGAAIPSEPGPFRSRPSLVPLVGPTPVPPQQAPLCYADVEQKEWAVGRADRVCLDTDLLRRLLLASGRLANAEQAAALSRDALVNEVTAWLGTADQNDWVRRASIALREHPNMDPLLLAVQRAYMPRLSRRVLSLHSNHLNDVLEPYANDPAMRFAFFGAVEPGQALVRAPPPLPNPLRYGVVINTQRGGEGSHWVAAYADDSRRPRDPLGVTLEYYDSMALMPPNPDVGETLRDFADLLRNAYGVPIRADGMEVLTRRKQRSDYECGVYAIHFLIERLHGRSRAELDAAPLDDEQCRRLRGHYWTLE